MTDADWVRTVATVRSALAAWVALGFSIYNAYARRRDRKPRVGMSARWTFPNIAKGAPGIFKCEITNVGIVGVKIREVYVWIP